MKKDPFDFSTWITESVSSASLEVIKKAISVLEGKSSALGHSFYILLITQDKDVILPNFLKLQYPQSITIVLENQFNNLKVIEEGFFVDLSFSGKLENIFIPFKAIVNFFDKSLNLSIPVVYDDQRLLKNNKKLVKKEKISTKKLSKSKRSNSNIIEFKGG